MTRKITLNTPHPPTPSLSQAIERGSRSPVFLPSLTRGWRGAGGEEQYSKGVRILLLLLPLLFAFSGSTAQQAAVVIVRAPAAVTAGAAWSAEIEVTSGSAGEKVDLAVFSGLQHLTEQVTTGTGGVARWAIPANVITQAGEGVLIARYGGEETRRSVRVIPGRAAQADLITTANALRAYGEARGTLIVLLRDEFGNPPRESAEAALTLTYPGGDQTTFMLAHRTGLAWTWFSSMGDPGRVRVHVTAESALADLEVRQVPGEAASITLAITPSCAAPDGRDVIRLSAQAVDSHGVPVVDGTLIRFDLGDGFGFGRVANGSATLSIPAPLQAGLYRYHASSGSVRSRSIFLRVTDEVCP